MSPTFSYRPSATMNRRVSGLRAYDLTMRCRTRSRSSMSLCSYPVHGAAAQLDALADRVVDRLVGDDDVASLGEGRDDTRDGGKGLQA